MGDITRSGVGSIKSKVVYGASGLGTLELRHDGAAKRNTPAGADGAGIDQPRLLWPMRSDMEGFKSRYHRLLRAR